MQEAGRGACTEGKKPQTRLGLELRGCQLPNDCSVGQNVNLLGREAWSGTQKGVGFVLLQVGRSRHRSSAVTPDGRAGGHSCKGPVNPGAGEKSPFL